MSEVESVIEFYDDICKDIAKSNLESLIEGFAGFKSPNCGNGVNDYDGIRLVNLI